MADHLITIYDAATGAIKHVQSARIGEEAGQCAAGEAWLEGRFSNADWRVDLATGLPAPLHEFTYVVETNRISNIPPGSLAVIAGVKHELGAETEITFDLEQPQTIHVAITHPLYRDLPDMIEVPCEPLP